MIPVEQTAESDCAGQAARAPSEQLSDRPPRSSRRTPSAAERDDAARQASGCRSERRRKRDRASAPSSCRCPAADRSLGEQQVKPPAIPQAESINPYDADERQQHIVLPDPNWQSVLSVGISEA